MSDLPAGTRTGVDGMPAPAGIAAALLGTTLAVVASVISSFMIATASVIMPPEMGLTRPVLGNAVAGFYTMAALTSLLTGPLVRVLGATAVMRAGCLAAAACALAIASGARNAGHIAVILTLGGVAPGLCLPVSNVLLATAVDRAKHGIALGFKQAALPLATLIAGLSMPLLGARLGWRSTFYLGAGIAILALVWVPRQPRVLRRDAAPHLPLGDRRLLWTVTGASVLALAAAQSLSVFIPQSAVVLSAWAPEAAGVLLAVGSTAGIIARIWMGKLADSALVDELRLIASMLALAAAAYVLLAATGRHPLFIGPGVVVAFGCGWGWNGLMQLAVVRMFPQAVARASGLLQFGIFAGAAAGPFLFGRVAAVSFPLAWLLAAAEVTMAMFLVMNAVRIRERLPRID